jgi:pimeloyl-ACP methyl ester carboxylesterase
MRHTMPATPADRTVPGDGVRLHVRDWDAGGSSGPTVVLLHGPASNARIWDGVAGRGVTCPVLLCPAGGQLADGKREAVERASRLLPDARVTWFEDAVHDIPLQRPRDLAVELARFAEEARDSG